LVRIRFQYADISMIDAWKTNRLIQRPCPVSKINAANKKSQTTANSMDH